MMASILKEFLIIDPKLDAPISEDQVSGDDKATDVELIFYDVSFSSDLSGVDISEEITCDFIQDILSENEDSGIITTILEADSKNSHQLKAPVSPCGSSDTDDVSSLLSQDDGYSSLSDCSASVCELLDPSDYNTLLETLADAISTDSPVVLGDACHNLAQCVPHVGQQSCVPDKTTSQDDQSQPEPREKVITNKPDVSYIEMIANALMENNNSAVLGDIYTHIMDTYPYYKHTTNSWKTSIRHNLSVNECFVKGKRSKPGYFWSVHASCIESFKNADFDRRKARRKVQHCNRDFSSALDEMKQLSELSRIGAESSSTVDGSMSRQISAPQYSGHTVGTTSCMPMSSTPIRAKSCVTNVQQYHDYSQQQQMSYNQAQHAYNQAQNAFIQPQNAFIQPQNAFIQPQNAFIQPQNAFIQPQNAYSQPQYGYHSQHVYNTGYYG